MTTARLRELRLTSFKSFRGATLPLGPVTVLTGRNSSGKSNALDALEVLSRLAAGEYLSDALDARGRVGGAIRGGSTGCPPHGENSFELGVTVETGEGLVDFDVRVQVEPELRVVEETLVGPSPDAAHLDGAPVLLLRSGDPWGADASFYSIAPELRSARFRRRTLLTSQLEMPTRLYSSEEQQVVVRAAHSVTSALRGIFHLDPVPSLMRSFVPSGDAELRRSGENLSAALGRLRVDDRPVFDRLVDLVREISDAPVQDLFVSESGLGDVMVVIRENLADDSFTPAREMSDGLLRFLAIATALVSAQHGLDLNRGSLGDGQDGDDRGLFDEDASAGLARGGALLVIEELENGLHPSQAARMLRLVEETARENQTQVLFTTHSPALLNALTGTLNDDVVVCYRDGEFGSRLSRVTELPGYADAMAGGRIGDLVSRGELTAPREEASDDGEFNRILGIE